MSKGLAIRFVGSAPDTRYATNWASLQWDFANFTSPQTANVLSFAFGRTSADYPGYAGGSEIDTMVEFTNEQKTCVRRWWADWSVFTGIPTVEFTGSDVQDAAIKYAKATLAGGQTAFSWGVGTAYLSGDIWVTNSGSWDNPQPGNGSWFLHGHESGHSVGQSHTHTGPGAGTVVGDTNFRSAIFTIMGYYQSQSDFSAIPFTYAWDNVHTWQMNDYRTQVHHYGKAAAGSRVTVKFDPDGQITRNGVARIKNPGSSIIYWTLNEVSPVKLDLTDYTSDFDLDLAYEAWSTLDSSQLAYIDQGNAVYAPGNFTTGIETQVDQVELNDGSHTVAFNSALTNTVFLPRNQSAYAASGADRSWVLTRGSEVNTFTSLDFVQFLDNLVAAADLDEEDPTVHPCTGNQTDYNWLTIGGQLRLVDNRDGSPDGTDDLDAEIETVEFANATVAKSSLTGSRRKAVMTVI